MSYAKARLEQVRAEQRLPAADVWTAPEYQLLALSELIRLPSIDAQAQRPGVYFLFRGSRLSRNPELVYVGMSGEVEKRVRTHRQYKEVLFNTATYLAIPWPWQLAIEALYIRAYSPLYNRTFSENKRPSIRINDR